MSGHTPASFDRIDALVVGAGFAGLYQLYRLRALGLSVKIFEAASGIGGTWHMNRYPGVRTDCEVVIYQYDLETVWKDWTWKDKYPLGEQIQAYFRYVDHKLDLKRDIYFNTRVTAQNGMSLHISGTFRLQVDSSFARDFSFCAREV